MSLKAHRVALEAAGWSFTSKRTILTGLSLPKPADLQVVMLFLNLECEELNIFEGKTMLGRVRGEGDLCLRGVRVGRSINV